MTQMQREPQVVQQHARRTVTTSAPKLTVTSAATIFERGPAAFSTLLGRREALDSTIAQWGRLMAATGLPELAAPVVLPQSAAVERADPAPLRVARVEHPAGLGPTLVAQLGRGLGAVGVGAVHVEEGYFVYPAARATPSSLSRRWQVSWRSELLHAVAALPAVQLAPHVLGAAFTTSWPDPRRIVVVDTGDEGAVSQVGCTVSRVAEEAAVDHHGHGTAVGELVRYVAPNASVHSYRITEPNERVAESSTLFMALIETVTGVGSHHIVVIPAQATIPVNRQGHRDSVSRILADRHQHHLPVPVLVCAAGNRRPGVLEMSYPAVVSGTVVAIGCDWTGEPAAYNCAVPRGATVFVARAPGGVSEADPIGTVRSSRGDVAGVYGSSYATAIVAGLLAAR